MPWARVKPYFDNNPDAMTTTPRNTKPEFMLIYPGATLKLFKNCTKRIQRVQRGLE